MEHTNEMQLIEEETEKKTERGRQLHRFLDKVTRLDNAEKIVVFGCGKRGSHVLELIQFMDSRICCLTDNSSLLWNTWKNSHVILAPEDAIAQYPDAFFIIANELHAQDIVKQLCGMGICKDMICVYGEA